MKGTHQGRKGNRPLRWDGHTDESDARRKRRRRRGLRRGIKRVSVYKRCKGKCVDCGMDVPFKGAEIHHIKALSDGGLNQDKNLILICTNCHDKRHGRTRRD